MDYHVLVFLVAVSATSIWALLNAVSLEERIETLEAAAKSFDTQGGPQEKQ